jgi:hypothetical protein
MRPVGALRSSAPFGSSSLHDHKYTAHTSSQTAFILRNDDACATAIWLRYSTCMFNIVSELGVKMSSLRWRVHRIGEVIICEAEFD